jgi:hypothetical protein
VILGGAALQRCDKALFSSTALAAEARVFWPLNLRRHQINQWKNEHPNQIHKVPIQPGDFHIMRVIIFRLQKDNHGRND